MQAVAYLRVSTEGQVGEDRYGLVDQRAAIEQYAARTDTEVIGWYEDAGISGATLARPGLNTMLKDAERGEFQAVLVAKMDRVARDLMLQLWIEKELLKARVEIISVAEPFRGQDPANVLFRQIIGAFAQFEKARIAERMSGGRKQKARAGGYAGGCPALGYRAERGGKVLFVDAAKTATVQRAFELREENPGWGLQQIADQLNAEGHTTARGASFRKMQVKRLLERQALYQGRYSYAGIESAGRQESLL